MIYVLLSHEVKNFADWKTGFEAHEAVRAAAGIKLINLFTSADNENMVTVLTEFPSMEAFQGFTGNPDFKAIMEAAGVIGQPEFKILNKVS